MASLEEDFARFASRTDYSLFIVTVAHEGERSGCLVGFASQVSIHPPRFLACLSVKNRTFQVAAQAETMVVHAVPEDADAIAELFGGETGDQIDKFARVDWQPGPDGAPVLSELESWFAGKVLSRYEFGDHVGFALEPTAVTVGKSHDTLTFRRGKWIEPGHEP